MNTVWTLPYDRSTYILRYFLPRPPYVDKEVQGKRLGELIDYCKRAGVEAVQFFVNMRPDWIYMPDTPDHALEWADEMKSVSRRLRDNSISYQLNIVTTVGHHAGGMDFREEYDWERLVDQNGDESLGCACPSGAKFRNIMGGQLRAWAATEPDVIWIDDDLRMHNHDHIGTGRDWFCFCPVHLGLFAKKTGMNISREELIKAILKPGEPSKERILWMDFIDETMRETALWISETIHEVSPKTRIAKMTSTPDVHSVEGMDWGKFLAALSGKEFRPIVRPHFGVYVENTPAGFVNSYLILNQTIKNMKIQHRGELDACPEIETAFYTRWVRSAAAFRYELLLGQLLGCPGITLSIYDWEGSPLDEEPVYEEVLAGVKPSLDQLALLKLNEWDSRGVAFLTHPDAARKIRLSKNAKYDSLLGPGRTWDGTLLQSGIPACYCSPEEATGYEVSALDGLTAWLPDDNEMKQLLSRGMLLDARAAEILVGRGYGNEIGIQQVDYIENYQTSSELFHGSILEGLPEKRMNMRLHEFGTGQPWAELKPADGSKILTTLIDPKGIRHPGTVIHENSFGGRTAVYAGFGKLGADFYNHARIQWFSSLLNWMSRGRFPVDTGTKQRVLTIRRDLGDKVLVAIANLAADRLKEISIKLGIAGCIESFKYLSNDGKWTAMDASSFIRRGNGQYELHIKSDLNVYEWMIMLIDVKKD